MVYNAALPLTLKLLRQDLGKTLGECKLGTVDSATSTTFTDADLIDSGESNTLFDRAWVKIGSDVRRMTAYDETTGTITVGRAFTTTPSAGDEYEIHTMISPADLDECINRALAKLYYEREQAIAVVADQTEYDLSGYAWITNKEQIIDVTVRLGDTTLEYRYPDLFWWRLIRKTAAEGTTESSPYTGVYLRVRPLSDTDASLVITGMCPYGILSSDTYATSAPYDWVMAGAEYNAYDLLMRDMASTDRKVEEARRKDAGMRFAAANRTYMPRPRMRVIHPDYNYEQANPLALQEEL